MFFSKKNTENNNVTKKEKHKHEHSNKKNKPKTKQAIKKKIKHRSVPFPPLSSPPTYLLPPSNWKQVWGWVCLLSFPSQGSLVSGVSEGVWDLSLGRAEEGREGERGTTLQTQICPWLPPTHASMIGRSARRCLLSCSTICWKISDSFTVKTSNMCVTEEITH